MRTLNDWTAPEIDAECRSAYSTYNAEIIRHYTAYFSNHKELAGAHRYSAANIEAALPPGWESLASKLPPKQRHRYHRSAKSSQILSLGLLGVALERDPTLQWLWDALDFDSEPPQPPFEVHFEYAVLRSLLNESPRVTSIDFLVQTSNLVVGIEVKWTERGFGQCSCARDSEVSGDDAAADDAPAMGECSQRVLERTAYWNVARDFFGLPSRSPGTYCPISTAYQAIRNVAAVQALAANKRAVFALIYDAANP
jgi:hypothetical protein